VRIKPPELIDDFLRFEFEGYRMKVKNKVK